MRLPKRGEKGFTLIELLIVIAILGVLAAVVLPNVGKFIGSGEKEAAETELANIQSAVSSMMIHNSIKFLPDPVEYGEATSDMSLFPDPNHALFAYGGNATINYIQTGNATGTYYIDAQGTVVQKTTGHE